MNRSASNEATTCNPRSADAHVEAAGTPSVGENVPRDLLDALGAMRCPVVIAHVVPDADALGSMFALAVALESSTCRPRVSLPEGSLSQRLRFLFERSRVQVAGSEEFKTADGFIALDTAKLDRCNVGPALKGTDWSAGRPLVNVDHHSTNTKFGTVNWVVDSASSTCELVYRLLRAAGRPISPTTASLLYAGIQTDTLGFSLPTVTPGALRVAGDLVELGADVGDLGERLCRSQSKSEFDLLRVIYANTRVLAEGRLAYSSASYEEIHGAGCSAADIDDQINVPRSLSGVELAMLFTEGRKGKTRINFRGSGAVTVIDLAAEFGGGGHMQAAGSVIDGSLHEVIEKVVPRAVQHLTKFARAQ